jgi:TM2 domain-containing membrane protein YozV
MNAATVVGWFLLVIGALFLLLGFIGAIAAVLKQAHGSGFDALGLPPEIPWADLFKLLLKQGAWGICIVLGLGLIIVGLALVAPQVFKSTEDANTSALLIQH